MRALILGLGLSAVGQVFGQTSPPVLTGQIIVPPRPASEPGTTSGLVTNTYADIHGKMYFTIDTASAKPPACATQSGRFALDTNTAGGRTIAGTVMAASAMGKLVNITGASKCSVFGDAEDVFAVKVQE